VTLADALSALYCRMCALKSMEAIERYRGQAEIAGAQHGAGIPAPTLDNGDHERAQAPHA